MFPPSMLESVYQRGSLKDTPNGLQFTLRNTVDSGTMVGIGPIEIDGIAYGAEKITMKTARGEWKGDQFSYRSPFYFSVGTEATIAIEGISLSPGTHRIVITANTAEIGPVTFEISDVSA
jgi:hydroxymethylglutaryl-CoA reductase (NADPH)